MWTRMDTVGGCEWVNGWYIGPALNAENVLRKEVERDESRVEGNSSMARITVLIKRNFALIRMRLCTRFSPF